MPIVALDNVGTHPLICTHHVTVFFGVELAGESSGVHQITKHHRELSAFSVRRRSSKGRFNLSGWLCLHNGLWCWRSRLRGDCLGRGSFTSPHEYLTILISGELVDFDEFILQDI